MAGTETEPRARRRLAGLLDGWPRRRLVAVAVLFPVLVAVHLVGAPAAAVQPAWTALVGLVALVSAAVLASYLPRPGAGRRLDIGCTPCAAVAALSVLLAAGMLDSAPGEIPSALLALGLVAIGLRQRLANPSTCPA